MLISSKLFSIVKQPISTFSLLLFFAVSVFSQDSRLRILEQPRPELPQNHGTLDVQGTVILRVQFLEFGEIGEIVPVKELPSGLTARAVAAAKRIKFEPEKREGKPVTVYREVEYPYSWNGGWIAPASEEPSKPAGDSKQAEEILARAVKRLGGERYLQVRSLIGKGKFSVMRGGRVISFQTFLDVIVYPDKERTEFKAAGAKHIQVNTASSGWVYDGDQELVKIQTDRQVEGFKQSVRSSLDHLLRSGWKGDAEIAYVGRRPASLGKRNDVVRLTYSDGFSAEFEFAVDDALPQKATYKRINSEGEDITEEDRYAQFVELNGIWFPFVVDRFTSGSHSSRINYESVEVNQPIPDSIFEKPASPKEARKEIKVGR
jgi:hypothetical protein